MLCRQYLPFSMFSYCVCFASAVCPGLVCRLDLYVALLLLFVSSFSPVAHLGISGCAEQMPYKRA